MSEPLYIKIDEYKDVDKVVKDIKFKLDETKQKIDKLKELRNKEMELIQSWEKERNNLHSHLSEIDKLINPGK